MSGWKEWDFLERVTSSEFQSYLQDQVVQVYASSTARSSALGTAVSEGMISYLSDTNALQYYDGSAWANVSQPGDITAVTAGTALTGGGTSGDVTLDVNLAAITIPVAQISDLTASATELNYVDGVTSDIQTQLNGKQATITGAATTITSDNLTVSRALASDGSGKVAATSVTSTELGYLSGVTSAIQTQLDAKSPFTQPVFNKTASYTAVAGDANDLLYFTNASVATAVIPDLFAIGDRIDVIRDGAGTVVIAAGTGVSNWGGAGTAGTAVTFKIDQQYNAATVYKVAANTYRVIGRITV